jgi:formylglycine-generating enzyme required for sulfatase activity
VILLGIYFYMGSAKKAEQPHLEPSLGARLPSLELAPSNPVATEQSPLNAANPVSKRAPSNLAAARPSNAAEAGSEFTDCADDCPQMIVVSAGKFIMGSPKNEAGRWDNEGPQREVMITKPFAVGKFTVTFDEWDACVTDGGGYRPKDEVWGRGRRPVINVSWDDAKTYVAWLSKKTGKAYRLLSEAEWEYAARAGTTTRYYLGNDIGTNNANCKGCGSKWDDEQTAPVGSFKPNAFGLYDMAGNVWEWVEDVWHDNYDGAPTDGSAWLGPKAAIPSAASFAAVPGTKIRRSSERPLAAGSPHSTSSSITGSGLRGRLLLETLLLYPLGPGRSPGQIF